MDKEKFHDFNVDMVMCSAVFFRSIDTGIYWLKSELEALGAVEDIEKDVLGMVRGNVGTDDDSSWVYGAWVAACMLQKLGKGKYLDPKDTYYLVDDSEEAEMEKDEYFENVIANRPESDYPNRWMSNNHPEEYEGVWKVYEKLLEAEPIATETTVTPFSVSMGNYIVAVKK